MLFPDENNAFAVTTVDFYVEKLKWKLSIKHNYLKYFLRKIKRRKCGLQFQPCLFIKEWRLVLVLIFRFVIDYFPCCLQIVIFFIANIDFCTIYLWKSPTSPGALFLYSYSWKLLQPKFGIYVYCSTICN